MQTNVKSSLKRLKEKHLHDIEIHEICNEIEEDLLEKLLGVVWRLCLPSQCITAWEPAPARVELSIT